MVERCATFELKVSLCHWKWALLPDQATDAGKVVVLQRIFILHIAVRVKAVTSPYQASRQQEQDPS